MKFLVNNKYEIGYDLLSKGSDNARKSVLELFNEHYSMNFLNEYL